jgi:hypothetical protein
MNKNSGRPRRRINGREEWREWRQNINGEKRLPTIFKVECLRIRRITKATKRSMT